MAGLRVGGLASGMDIDQIVGDLMKAQRIPLDKLLQKKTTFEWQRDSYRSINTKLKAFDTYLFDNFSLSSNFNKKTVASTNEGAVTATANSSATGSLTIDSVTSLAKNATGVSASNISFVSGKTAEDNMTESLGLPAGEQTIEFEVYKDGKMETTSFKFDPSTTTYNQFISKVNSSNAGITMFYDNASGKTSISSKYGGDNAAGAEVKIKTDSEGVFGKIGFSTNDLASGGKNAVVSVNGMEITRTSNEFVVNGFTINLKAETTTATTITAKTDVNSMVDKVKEFVSKYNELISGMNDSLKEKKYRDFPPLTDEQRKDMTETEQKLWDEKAKSGLLRSDSIVSAGLSDMRNAIYGQVGMDKNMIDTLAEMGITTSSVYSDGGKLVIDEDKLKKALTENPDQVVKTLTQSGEKTTTSGDTRGIVQRLRDSMKEFTTKIETKAGKSTWTDQQYTIGKSLIDTNTRISNFQNRLKDMEARYWKQFTAMETAINKANSQSSYLSQFGQG